MSEHAMGWWEQLQRRFDCWLWGHVYCLVMPNGSWLPLSPVYPVSPAELRRAVRLAEEVGGEVRCESCDHHKS